MYELSQFHVPNAHTLSHRMASHSYVNVAFLNRGNINNTIQCPQAKDMCGCRLGDPINFL